MHRDESDGLVTCLDCGTELASGTDRDFEFGVAGVLCWSCAERRGGTYDENQSRWTASPDISDLADVAHERD
jgi:hypothetical protein